MKLDKVLELLKIERECVTRQNGDGCRRDITHNCNSCDLVQSDADILQMYDIVISLVEEKIAYNNMLDKWSSCLPGGSSDT